MARVITYTPTAPTNFSDGNVMFNGAIQNMNQAFKTGIDTANTLGQNVRDRNQAVLDSIINGISQEDLAKPDTQLMLSNVIRDMEHNSAGMVDLGKAFGAIDKRGSVLVDRNNAQLENQENQIKAQNMQDANEARQLLSMGKAIDTYRTIDPTKAESLGIEFDTAYKSASPNVLALFDEARKARDLGNIKYDGEWNTALYSRRQSREKMFENAIKLAGDEEYRATEIINNPSSTPEEKALAVQARNFTRENMARLGIDGDTYIGATQLAKASRDASKAKHQDTVIDQANKDRDYALKHAIANSTINSTALRDDLAVHNAVYGKNSENSGDGSSTSSKKKLTETEEKMANRGYTSEVISSKGINPLKLIVLMHNDLTNFSQNSKALQSNVSYTQFLKTDEANLSKVTGVNDNGDGFTTTKSEELETILKGMNIPDDQKIALHLRYKQKGFGSVDTWNPFSKDLKKDVKEELEYLRVNPDKVIKGDYENFRRELLGNLTAMSGISSAELLKRLTDSGIKLPKEVFEAFPVEDKVGVATMNPYYNRGKR